MQKYSLVKMLSKKFKVRMLRHREKYFHYSNLCSCFCFLSTHSLLASTPTWNPSDFIFPPSHPQILSLTATPPSSNALFASRVHSPWRTCTVHHPLVWDCRGHRTHCCVPPACSREPSLQGQLNKFIGMRMWVCKWSLGFYFSSLCVLILPQEGWVLSTVISLPGGRNSKHTWRVISSHSRSPIFITLLNPKT